jgi:hypothetical protein
MDVIVLRHRRLKHRVENLSLTIFYDFFKDGVSTPAFLDPPS